MLKQTPHGGETKGERKMKPNGYQVIARELVTSFSGYAIGHNRHNSDAPYAVFSVYIIDGVMTFQRPNYYLREVDARIAYYENLLDEWTERKFKPYLTGTR